MNRVTASLARLGEPRAFFIGNLRPVFMSLQTGEEVAEHGPGLGAEAFLDGLRVVAGDPNPGNDRTGFRQQREPVAVKPVRDAAPAVTRARFERRQQPVPHRAVEFSLGGVQFLCLERFDRLDQIGLVIGAFEVSAHPVKSVRHTAGNLARGQRVLQGGRRGLQNLRVAKHPGVPAGPTRFRNCPRFSIQPALAPRGTLQNRRPSAWRKRHAPVRA